MVPGKARKLEGVGGMDDGRETPLGRREEHVIEKGKILGV